MPRSIWWALVSDPRFCQGRGRTLLPVALCPSVCATNRGTRQLAFFRSKGGDWRKHQLFRVSFSTSPELSFTQREALTLWVGGKRFLDVPRKCKHPPAVHAGEKNQASVDLAGCLDASFGRSDGSHRGHVFAGVFNPAIRTDDPSRNGPDCMGRQGREWQHRRRRD